MHSLEEVPRNKLFSPVKLGPYELSHRVVMAPLMRMRSEPGDIPGDLMVQYYAQRAFAGGLIISEATPASIRGYGYAGAPGVYSDRQIAGWRRVTEAVHAKGGRIVMQLWHVGRQSHTDLQPNGEPPVATACSGKSRRPAPPRRLPNAFCSSTFSTIVFEVSAKAATSFGVRRQRRGSSTAAASSRGSSTNSILRSSFAAAPGSQSLSPT